METLSTEVVIAGGGLAGIVTAYELLDRGRRVLLFDKDKRENFGGLAKESFGGVHLIGTPHQRRIGVRDNPEIAWQDWQRVAHYEEVDNWPRQWGRFYCENSLEYIFEFLTHKKITFLPVVNWAERGIHAPGNSVPRWHIVWGTGFEIIRCLLNALEAHPNRENLELRFDSEVSSVEMADGRAVGVAGPGYRVHAEHVVIASGGICGGDLSKVRATWYRPWGAPPQQMLHGAHIYADGALHDRVAEIGGAVTHLDLHWHYAAGIHHPAKRKPDDGLSLVPPRSALWLNANGERIMNPGPMLSYGDTRHLVASVATQPGQYSWQVLNWKIAIRELAVSGCDYMTAFRQKDRVRLVRDLLVGNKELVERLIRECPDDIVTADSLDDLMEQMDRHSLLGLHIDRSAMEACIRAWDDMIARGPAFHNDEQLRRIANFRAYSGDKARTCNFQKILDPKARPLIAIREFILTRKSLGGIQTDLQCRVLRCEDGAPIPGLYAVGEAAGFGGGGIHGQGSLEGTFLGGCVLSGRLAGRSIGT